MISRSRGLPIFVLVMLMAVDIWCQEPVHRSPVDVVVGPDETWLATANQTSHSVSLVSVATGQVLDELPLGERPEYIECTSDGRFLLVTSSRAGELAVVAVDGQQLVLHGRIQLGGRPHGIAVSRDGQRVWIALTAVAQVAVVDLPELRVRHRFSTGRWPRYLALNGDESRLVVGTSGDRGVTVIDAESGEVLASEKFMGLNIGHLQTSRDGNRVWLPWAVYRQNPITVSNIQRGWVLATRVGRVYADGSQRREAMSLDPQGEAVGDPFGMDLTEDDQQAVVSAAGTKELLVYRVHDLPLKSRGSTDHIPAEVLEDAERFWRIPLGGRPLGLQISTDNRRVWIANYLRNSVQEVDLQQRRVSREISLGAAPPDTPQRQGEALFYDATLSRDQWYSCHTCHYEGGTNAVTMDTFNDDTPFTNKSVLSLYGVAETGPWTWHGRRNDLPEAVSRSITETMLGKVPSDDDVAALTAFLTTIPAPASSNGGPDQGREAERLEVQRGRAIFSGQKAGCLTCHSGPRYTDGENHDLGLSGERDKYPSFNTPSLIGVGEKVTLLHDGRAASLEALLTGPHRPEITGGSGELSAQELADLIAFLQSL